MPKYITEFSADFANRPLSYSSLKAFIKSPQHFVEYRLGAKKESDAMAFGTLLDVMILTPDEYEAKFVVQPEHIKKPTSSQANAKNPSEATLKQIEEYNKWVEENKGKTWVSQEDVELAKFLAEKTFANAKAKELLSRLQNTQKRIEWTNKETGLPMLGYVDGDGDTFIMDLKTAADGSHEGFTSNAYKLGYHIQAGAYLDAYKTLYGKFPDYFNLVVETTAPYNISVYKASNDFLQLGKEEYERALVEIKFCEEQNLWFQGYEFHSAIGYHQLDLPGWAKSKLNRYK